MKRVPDLSKSCSGVSEQGGGGNEITVVGIGGTMRPGSSSETALRAVLEATKERGAQTKEFLGPALAEISIFDPQVNERPDVVFECVEAVRRADIVLIASPGYHGAISGLVKNAIDYPEDLRVDERPYLTGRAMDRIATGEGWRTVYDVIGQLRAIGVALRAWLPLTSLAIVPRLQDDRRTIRQVELLAEDLMLFASSVPKAPASAADLM